MAVFQSEVSGESRGCRHTDLDAAGNPLDSRPILVSRRITCGTLGCLERVGLLDRRGKALRTHSTHKSMRKRMLADGTLLDAGTISVMARPGARRGRRRRHVPGDRHSFGKQHKSSSFWSLRVTGAGEVLGPPQIVGANKFIRTQRVIGVRRPLGWSLPAPPLPTTIRPPRVYVNFVEIGRHSRSEHLRC